MTLLIRVLLDKYDTSSIEETIRVFKSVIVDLNTNHNSLLKVVD